MDSKRIYTKIDETTFKVEQDRHLEEEMKVADQLNVLAQLLNNMKQCVAQANDYQEKFVKIAESYNTFVDILQEAKDSCGYKYKLPAKIEIPDCFDIIEVKIENLPSVDISKEK